MAEMELIIMIQTEEAPSPQSYTGGVVSEAQAFMAGVSGTFKLVQCRMHCTTPAGEAHDMQRSASEAECELMMVDIDNWLLGNAAYE